MDKDTNVLEKAQGRPQIQVCSEHLDVLLTKLSQVQDRECGTPGPL